ncbi:orotate phosphoribosyltransferase [Ignavibacteria bacterium]|nr:orotate phosphoribosyltransferase [Bacteroidota bacterium]MCZ2132635.1 orotate phosphoribosyltransferase [Bacteroidota bacterium]
MDKATLAKNVFQTAHLTGVFTLRSGRVSNVYFDKYQFESRPELLRVIAEKMAEMLPPETEVLAGLEVGGIPIATAISLHTGLPTAFVRKKAKEYGTMRVSEGSNLNERKIVIIEDVITSGGQVLLSAEDLRALGAQILCCLCVIDRESGGREALAEAGIPLQSVFTMSELQAAAGHER